VINICRIVFQNIQEKRQIVSYPGGVSYKNHHMWNTTCVINNDRRDIKTQTVFGVDSFFRLYALAPGLHAEQNGTQTRSNGIYIFWSFSKFVILSCKDTSLMDQPWHPHSWSSGNTTVPTRISKLYPEIRADVLERSACHPFLPRRFLSLSFTAVTSQGGTVCCFQTTKILSCI